MAIDDYRDGKHWQICDEGERLLEAWCMVAFEGTKAEAKKWKAYQDHRGSCPACTKPRTNAWPAAWVKPPW